MLAFLGRESRDSWAMVIMLEKFDNGKKSKNVRFGGKRKWIGVKGKSK